MIARFTYVNRPSPIHRLDPAAKVVFLLCYIFSIVLFLDVRALAVMLLIGIVYYRLTGLKWQETRRAWKFILIFALIFIGISAVLWGGGQTVAEPHIIWQGPLGFDLTWEKLYYAAGIIMRMLGIAFVSIPLTFTTQPHDYGVGFKGIGLPDKFAVAIDLALRLVPTFASDFQSTMDAQRARGYETEGLRGGPIAKLRRMSPIVVPVTIGAIVSGEDIINAMDLRAFGSGPRTWSRKRQRTPADKMLIAFSLLMLVLCISWALTGHGAFEVFWVPGA
ncbi:MAG: energy-coupling factor transport system permease protein [Chloroflexia bacterium]|nr:energy-coupling factor transport system permease protein [Chloroflexia bacterium]